METDINIPSKKKSNKQKTLKKQTFFFVGIISAPDKTSRFRSLSLVLLSELYRFKIHRATLPFIDLKLKSHCTVPLYRRPHAVLILNFRYCVAGGALAVGPLSLRGLRLGHLSNHSEHQDGLSTHYHQPYYTITAQNTRVSSTNTHGSTVRHRCTLTRVNFD
jgi:hypothetical protein